MESIVPLILEYSYIGIFTVIFFESAIVLGVFLPGDSFLFFTGIVAAKGGLDIWYLIPTIIAAAIMGNEFGFWLGKRFGWLAVSSLSKKYASPDYHTKAHSFYEKWGIYAVIIARFVPVMRSLVSTVAGMAQMSRTQFTLANIFGAVLWATTVPLVGYIVGDTISNRLMFELPIAGFILFGIGLPLFLKWWHGRKKAGARVSAQE